MKSAILWVATVVAAILLVRSLWPRTVEVPSAPRIVTQYDTVARLDTAWITRLRHDTIRVNVTERVVVTVPETIYAAPRVRGMTALHAGKRVGDSTLVGGFVLEPLDSGYTRREFLVQFYTLGPVRSVTIDSVPRITFYPVPAKPCQFFCKAGHYLTGAAIGFGVASLLK